MKKYSVKIAGHSTSISLEPEFWNELKELCISRDISINQFVSGLDEQKTVPNLSSAIRLEILKHLKNSN